MVMSRLLEFDLAKAICIILVVMGHYAVDNPSWWVTTHDIIYTFHMPLFLFASGFIYIAFKKEESYGHFLQKKVKRLIIPYLTVSVIIVSLKLMSQSGMYVQNPVTQMSYLKILYLPEAGYFLWFVWALWWMFCLVPLFKSKGSRIFLFCVAVILHMITPYVYLPEVFCIRETADMLIWFMLGVICFDWSIRINNVKIAKVGISLFAFVAVLFVCGTGGLPSFGMVDWLSSPVGGGILIRLLRPCCGIIFIMTLSKWISQHKVPNWMLVIAASSYIIYLFHTTFMGFTKAMLMKFSFIQSMPVLTILIVVISGVLCPVLLHRLLKLTKVTRFLLGI